jgi:hypothetical protein
MAWHDMAWKGNVKGMTRHGNGVEMTWHGKAWHGLAWNDMAWHGKAWKWHGMS